MADRSLGVEDPYAHVDRCDHLTDDGRCRFAFESFRSDPAFARRRRADEYRCPVVNPSDDWSWADCPNFTATTSGKECRRCGLTERPNAHTDQRPLVEAHHLVYPDEQSAHEITIGLCRWCHAKVHDSWARIDDDVSPDPEAIATREQRRSQEADEFAFRSAADRRDTE